MTDFVRNIEVTASNLADATLAEMRLEDNRIAVKLAAIERIMASGDNSLTGKPHSYSSAESIVTTDMQYQDYLAEMRNAVRARIIARGNYEASLAAARLQEDAHV
jgi:hypothetical protein